MRYEIDGEYTIGYDDNGVERERFISSSPQALDPPSQVLSRLSFFDLFTEEELSAIYTAAKSTVQVEIAVNRFNAAIDIRLDDPRTIAAVAGFEQLGLISQSRKSEILGEVQ